MDTRLELALLPPLSLTFFAALPVASKITDGIVCG
jgi:hypothetical protein